MSVRTPTTERFACRITDSQMEQIIGNLLRIGVILAAVFVLIGGILFLGHHGSAYPEYRVFHGVPTPLRDVPGIMKWALAFQSRGIIQLGILLLIATPVARVVLALFGFALQRDRAYVGVTLLVLCILLYSLFSGAHI